MPLVPVLVGSLRFVRLVGSRGFVRYRDPLAALHPASQLPLPPYTVPARTPPGHRVRGAAFTNMQVTGPVATLPSCNTAATADSDPART